MTIIQPTGAVVVLAGQTPPWEWDKVRCDNCGREQDWYSFDRQPPRGVELPPPPTGWVILGVWPADPSHLFDNRLDFCGLDCCRAYWRSGKGGDA